MIWQTLAYVWNSLWTWTVVMTIMLYTVALIFYTLKMQVISVAQRLFTTNTNNHLPLKMNVKSAKKRIVSTFKLFILLYHRSVKRCVTMSSSLCVQTVYSGCLYQARYEHITIVRRIQTNSAQSYPLCVFFLLSTSNINIYIYKLRQHVAKTLYLTLTFDHQRSCYVLYAVCVSA